MMLKKKGLIFLSVIVFWGLGGITYADLFVVGSASNLELMSNLVIAFGAKTGISVDLRGPGSLEGLHHLIKGKASLAFISRSLSMQEEAMGLKAVPYCRDAVAVVVHPANRVADLTVKDLRAIFTGNCTRWADGSQIVVLIRDGFSGTRQLFQEKIMGGETFSPSYITIQKKGQGIIFKPIFSTFHPPFIPRIEKDEEMLFSLAKIRGAIAYRSMGGIPKESKVVKINGVSPTRENIQSGRYLLSRTPMLVTRFFQDRETRQLVEFIVGAEGQKIVARMGYIPAYQ